MYRFMLKTAAGLAVIVASIAALGTASVPAARADSGIGLCIGCPASQSAPQGSTSVCVNSANCASWFYSNGYLVWGPETLFTPAYMVKRYYYFTGNGAYYLGFYNCLYLLSSNSMFSGCYWHAG